MFNYTKIVTTPKHPNSLVCLQPNKMEKVTLSPQSRIKTPLQRDSRRNHTEFSKNEIGKRSKHQLRYQFVFNNAAKPSTAPNYKPPRSDFVRKFQQLESINDTTPDQSRIPQVPHANYKALPNNRKPLLFIKPYMRYKNQSMSISKQKEEIYREIKNPNLDKIDESPGPGGFIEYFTEYNLPQSTRQKETPRVNPKPRHNRASLNVLRCKLKRTCPI